MTLTEILGIEMPKGFRPLIHRAIFKILEDGGTIHSEIPGAEGFVVKRVDQPKRSTSFDIQINLAEGKSTWFELIPEDDDKLVLSKIGDDEYVLSVLPGEDFKI